MYINWLTEERCVHLLAEERCEHWLAEERCEHLVAEERCVHLVAEKRCEHLVAEERCEHLVAEERCVHKPFKFCRLPLTRSLCLAFVVTLFLVIVLHLCRYGYKPFEPRHPGTKT